MAFIETLDGAELVIDYEINGAIYHSVLHIRDNTGWDLTSLEECRDTIQNSLVNGDGSVFCDNVTITGFTLTDVSVYGGLQVTNQVTPLLVGTAIDNSASVNNALGVKKNTAKTGRAFWGYLYHIGVPEGAIGDTVIDPLYIASVVSFWNDFTTDLFNQGFGVCVRQKQINGVAQNPYQLERVTSWSVANAKVASVKRRLRR